MGCNVSLKEVVKRGYWQGSCRASLRRKGRTLPLPKVLLKRSKWQAPVTFDVMERNRGQEALRELLR